MVFLGSIMPKYIGLFSKDLINSRENMGVEFWKNGKIRYKGFYHNDSRNTSFGIAYCPNGHLYYVGGYEDGKFSKKGVCYWDGNDEERGYGIRAIGEFKGGLLHGRECAIFDRKGRLRYFGRLEDGRKKEIGSTFDENGEPIITIIE